MKEDFPKKLLPAPREDAGAVTCIQPHLIERVLGANALIATVTAPTFGVMQKKSHPNIGRHGVCFHSLCSSVSRFLASVRVQAPLPTVGDNSQPQVNWPAFDSETGWASHCGGNPERAFASNIRVFRQ